MECLPPLPMILAQMENPALGPMVALTGYLIGWVSARLGKTARNHSGPRYKTIKHI